MGAVNQKETIMFEVIKVGEGSAVVNSSSAVNHVYVVDVSGSMYGSLPRMRQHLKNTVSMVTNPEDTFSIIYFSGKGQCGIVCEEVPVKDISSVTSIQKTIDRWLQPMGLTGFNDPIKLACDLGGRLVNGNANSFVMLTDGYDNQSKKSDIIESCKVIPAKFDSVTFIEYGWYCDRDLLAKMCEAAGATHVFADGIESYEDKFENAISVETRYNMISVPVNKKAKHAVYVSPSNEIVIVDVEESHQVKVPECVEYVYSIVPKDVLQKQLSEDRLYVVLYYAVKMNNSKLAWRCLEALGDVHLVKNFTNAFSRQEITAFSEQVKGAILDESMRFIEGKDLNFVPKEDAATIYDVLSILASTDGAQMVTDSKFFKYNKTAPHTEKAAELPRFIPSDVRGKDVAGLVFNKNRANVSIQAVEEGSVELPENEFGLKFIDSKQTRNYTIIRDGILNVGMLDLIVPEETYTALVDMTDDSDAINMIRVMSSDGKRRIALDLKAFPVINRSMVSEITLDSFSELVQCMLQVQGRLKGLRHWETKDTVAKSSRLADQYGEDAAKWLSSIGVRDYGFSPKVTTKKSGDCYVATEVTYKAKGLSSFPATNAVLKKVEQGKKLTISESAVMTGIQVGEKMDASLLTHEIKTLERIIKDVQSDISGMVYSMIIGKAWFSGIDDDTAVTEIDVGGMKTSLSITVSKKEIEI